eukprot:11222211-Lingulodinium_polyedra.AAC.1
MAANAHPARTRATGIRRGGGWAPLQRAAGNAQAHVARCARTMARRRAPMSHARGAGRRG